MEFVFARRLFCLTFNTHSSIADEAFVDLHPVDGLRGVYIASQLKQSASLSTKFGIDEVISVVTYDQGGQWETLRPPQFDDDGNPIYCQYVSTLLGQFFPEWESLLNDDMMKDLLSWVRQGIHDSSFTPTTRGSPEGFRPSFYPREGLRQGPLLNTLAGYPYNEGVGKEKTSSIGAGFWFPLMPGTPSPVLGWGDKGSWNWDIPMASYVSAICRVGHCLITQFRLRWNWMWTLIHEDWFIYSISEILLRF